MSESDKTPNSNPNNIIQFPLKAKTVFTKSEKAYVSTNEVKISNPKPPPKRIEVNNPLTKQQRTELQDWITEWVTTSNLAKKPISYGAARTRLYEDGLQGEVNGVEQIDQSELPTCISYIKQRIRILETVGNKRVMIRKGDYRNGRISAIHARCKELGVSDEIRKAYQLYKYEKISMKDFPDDELDHYYSYVMHGTPKFFIPKKAVQSVQQDRENALLVLLGVLEGEAIEKGQQFNRLALSQSKEEMLAMLEQRDPALFNEVELGTFEEFWKKQKHCKCRKGPKIGQSAHR